jgi:hypothetical protein
MGLDSKCIFVNQCCFPRGAGPEQKKIICFWDVTDSVEHGFNLPDILKVYYNHRKLPEMIQVVAPHIWVPIKMICTAAS